MLYIRVKISLSVVQAYMLQDAVISEVHKIRSSLKHPILLSSLS